VFRGRLLLLSGTPQEQIRLHLRDLLFRKLGEIHLPANKDGVYHCSKRILFCRAISFEMRVLFILIDNTIRGNCPLRSTASIQEAQIIKKLSFSESAENACPAAEYLEKSF
jgi:hypothetical protein